MKNSNEQSIKDILKDLVETYRLKSKLHQTRIELVWEQAMGKMIANYTTELKVRGDKLFVGISSAPLRQELSYGREQIVAKMNAELGEDFLKEVVIRG
ncbi:MAG TPA: DUF721 domain-containing protein [Saprospiraceae bacterium]|nr:DUF721 domain-containing protein [Saprospiraceae bacterium]HMP25163.1 DUF721 domain-containing protein [Saprospiraceae bacterium]